MVYTPELVATLLRDHDQIQMYLDDLCSTAIQVGNSLTNESAKDHMIHGAGRRLRVMKRCISNVFELFPPSTERPLDSRNLEEVQIGLQAFVINMHGYFEILAWSFVYRHHLLEEIRDRMKVGLFLRDTQRFLPENLRQYLKSTKVVVCQKEDLKKYRDALVHRIPLYIPPAQFTTEESNLFSTLESEKIEAIWSRNLGRLKQIEIDQSNLGKAIPISLHSFTEVGTPKPLYLHPQLHSDIQTILDFSPKFFEHWHNRT